MSGPRLHSCRIRATHVPELPSKIIPNATPVPIRRWGIDPKGLRALAFVALLVVASSCLAGTLLVRHEASEWRSALAAELAPARYESRMAASLGQGQEISREWTALGKRVAELDLTAAASLLDDMQSRLDDLREDVDSWAPPAGYEGIHTDFLAILETAQTALQEARACLNAVAAGGAVNQDPHCRAAASAWASVRTDAALFRNRLEGQAIGLGNTVDRAYAVDAG